MARRNTVNFLQIENGLKTAIAKCDAEAGQPWANRYRERLVEISTYMVEATRRADLTYLDWRSAMRERLLVAKRLWERFDRIREDLGEYGIAAEPAGRVGYFEGDDIRDAARTLFDFLGRIDPEEVPEVPAWRDELRGRLEELAQALRNEDKALGDYRRVAPLRRQAIYRAMEAVDEFESVRRDYLR